ncbi:MAG: peroxiredoxin [Candidatus Rehaiarchaeum fermentans]|nr:peroxiredoxin [Candidatus Rehaiarchaeum fermentans]
MKVKEGDDFPDFKLMSDAGNYVSLSDLKGKRVIIYFYPKDDTPGCTKEACNFRDNINEIRSLNVEIYGVSVDTIESHKKFKEKYSLPFTLLSDHDKQLSKTLGILGVFGTDRRVTFIVNNGKIEKIFPKVSPDKHAKEIIEYLKSSQSV